MSSATFVEVQRRSDLSRKAVSEAPEVASYRDPMEYLHGTHGQAENRRV